MKYRLAGKRYAIKIEYISFATEAFFILSYNFRLETYNIYKYCSADLGKSFLIKVCLM